ncbi:MAG: hypothetical protein IKZ88_00750 [Neisseriaceae bacterium]|nr:hypothetical protein [Neisseriaceae bacterium]
MDNAKNKKQETCQDKKDNSWFVFFVFIVNYAAFVSLPLLMFDFTRTAIWVAHICFLVTFIPYKDKGCLTFALARLFCMPVLILYYLTKSLP